MTAPMAEGAVKRLALLGVGYMGGSLALAARAGGLVAEVIGFDRDPAAGEIARARGIVDRMATDPAAAVKGASFVVLAAPVRSLAALAEAIAPAVESDAVVIDIGSVKAPVVAAVAATALRDRFVGCHPLAGTEASGPGAAEATLYQGKPCFVCAGPGVGAAAVAGARALWQAVGASVIDLPPREHDDFMAAGSHLPHVSAFALALALEEDEAMLQARIPPTYPPTSLRDCTRVAASNPAVWRDIFIENAAELAPRVRRLEARLGELRAALERGDGASLSTLLTRAQTTRKRVVR